MVRFKGTLVILASFFAISDGREAGASELMNGTPMVPQLGSQPFISYDPNDVHFYLFPSRSDPSQREIVYGDAKSLEKSGIIRNIDVRLYIHGFTGNYTRHGCLQLKNAFLKRNYKNFICVDYGKLSAPDMSYISPVSPLTNVFYPLILTTSKVVARRVAEFLIFLKTQKVVKKYSDFHLIGISLGSHVSGGAGQHIQDKTKSKIGRITGLDPAGPLFDQVIPPNSKLDKNKAEFVDVIHTGAGLYGTKALRGHVDFFANGGRQMEQDACKNKSIGDTCGHAICADYYQRAILGENFLGCPCQFNTKAPVRQPCPKPRTCQPKIKFGFPLPESSYGTYYVAVPLYPPSEIAKDYEPFRGPGSMAESL